MISLDTGPKIVHLLFYRAYEVVPQETIML